MYIYSVEFNFLIKMSGKKKFEYKQLELFELFLFNCQKSIETVVDNVEKDIKLDNSNVIKNISFDQKEIIWNIMQLYNNGQPIDCDMTASSLKFYEPKKSDKYNIPEPKILFDVYPQQDRIQKITPFGKLPLEDNSIHSIMVDLPFVISPKTCASFNVEGTNMIAKRFSSWYPYMEAYENMYWWIQECNRVLDDGGILIYKMQDTISGSIFHSFIEFAKICAQNLDMYMIDEFILEAKARLIASSKIKQQQHARKFTSNFLVFKKDNKLGSKFNPLKIYEQCKNNVFEGKKWEYK